MYTEYFGLKEMPFAAEPNPRLLVLMEEHREALATMVYAIEQQEGWALIVGEPGVGKTTLIMALLRELGERVNAAVITNPTLTPLDFLNQVALELGLEGPFASKGPFLATLGQFINRCRLQGRKVLLVVDEAQDLSAEMVEELRLLGNLDASSPRVLNILLVGQPELIRVLKRSASRALLQRLHRNYALKPLNATASAEYIRQRLTLAGSQREIFEPEALEAVHEMTGGVPRLINAVCDDALLLAYSSEVGKVNREMVIQASRDNPALDLDEGLDQVPPPPPRPSPEAFQPASEPPDSAMETPAAPLPQPPAGAAPRLGKLRRQVKPAPEARQAAKASLDNLAIESELDEAAPAKRGIFSRFAASLSREAPGSLWKRFLVLCLLLGLVFGGYFGGKRAYHWVKARFFGEIQLFRLSEELPDNPVAAPQERRQDWGPLIKGALDTPPAKPGGGLGGPLPPAPEANRQLQAAPAPSRPGSANDE